MQRTYSICKAKAVSGAATFVTTLIIVTPVCGLLFQCGCDWPWSGLDAHCNFYKPGEAHQCPWCASLMAGIASAGMAIVSAVLAAMTPALALAALRPVDSIALRILFGLIVFVAVAIVSAGVAALWQHYPLGLGSFFV